MSDQGTRCCPLLLPSEETRLMHGPRTLRRKQGLPRGCLLLEHQARLDLNNHRPNNY